MDQLAQRLVNQLRIKVARLSTPVRTLSGGNQQKVAIARWLTMSPKVLILDEPTKGIDVGAKEEVFAALRELSDLGTGILYVSTELAEVASVCDRAVVMADGAVVAILDGDGLTERRLLDAAHREGA